MRKVVVAALVALMPSLVVLGYDPQPRPAVATVGGINLDFSEPTIPNAKGKTIVVVNKLPKAWPVKKALAIVDKHTMSRYKISKVCPKNAWKCITFKPGAIPGGKNGPIGNAKCSGNQCVIRVDLKDAKRSGHFNAKTRLWLLVHETGHTLGLPHQTKCKTAMYDARRCGTRVPPTTFNASQKRQMSVR